MEPEYAVWRKSSQSGANNCVEVAQVDGKVAVRDSKNKLGPILVFVPTEWQAFIEGVRDGEFDLPSNSATESSAS